MASRGRITTVQERIEMGERSDAGQTDPVIAEATGWSVWTVRKWRRKWQQQGRGGLASKMGRPPGGALAHFSAEVRRPISIILQRVKLDKPFGLLRRGVHVLDKFLLVLVGHGKEKFRDHVHGLTELVKGRSRDNRQSALFA